jgi:membrane-associated phospholipid phosphatase
VIAVALALAMTATDKVDVRPAVDLTIAGIGLAGFAFPELLSSELAAAHCRWCDGADNTGLPGTGSRGSLNAVDAWFHDATTGWLVSRRTADIASSVLAFGLVPAAGAVAAWTSRGPHATDGAGWRAALIVGESAAVSAALVQGLKFVTARKRPFVRYGTGETGGSYEPSESNLSFPSGHTALATSVGVAVATTATLEESTAAPWLWAGAAVASVTTATLRMMAERHYFTDVAAGAAIGAACGVAFPLLHRRGGALSSSSASGAAPGSVFTLSGRF